MFHICFSHMLANALKHSRSLHVVCARSFLSGARQKRTFAFFEVYSTYTHQYIPAEAQLFFWENKHKHTHTHTHTHIQNTQPQQNNQTQMNGMEWREKEDKLWKSKWDGGRTRELCVWLAAFLPCGLLLCRLFLKQGIKQRYKWVSDRASAAWATLQFLTVPAKRTVAPEVLTDRAWKKE